ncbi:DUF4834 domain-containing protein [Leadbetterella sp. DM7]|uniref:DUF4834 domain-containing protein n=1 Tax=Leadbetterella sp. DM7 TaxID=3235085 RepID=UPI00349E90F5
MKFLFLLFLFFILIGPVVRFVFRMLVMNKVVQEQKKYYEKQRPTRKEGDIRVENATPNRPQRSSDSDGQYIDYEEVK